MGPVWLLAKVCDYVYMIRSNKRKKKKEKEEEGDGRCGVYMNRKSRKVERQRSCLVYPSSGV
jgi:hypothetical protein